MKKLTLIIALLVIGAMVYTPLAWAPTEEPGWEPDPVPDPIIPISGDLGTRSEFIEIWFTRDAYGRLIGQSGKITVQGVDLTGNYFEIATWLTYEIINNQAALTHTYSETHTWNDDGSESWTFRNVYNDYTENRVLIGARGDTYEKGFRPDRPNFVDEDGDGQPDRVDQNGDGVIDEQDKVDTDGDGEPDSYEYWYWQDADGDGVIDEDGDGNPIKTKDPEQAHMLKGFFFETNSTQTFEIINGEAQIIESVSETFTYADDTKAETIAYSKSTTAFDYEVILGIARLMQTVTETYSEDRQNYDPDGNPGRRFERIVVTYERNEVGSLIDASGTGTAAGTELTAEGWKSYAEDITDMYAIFNGVAQLIKRETVKDSELLTDDFVLYDPEVTGKFVGLTNVAYLPYKFRGAGEEYDMFVTEDGTVVIQGTAEYEVVEVDGESTLKFDKDAPVAYWTFDIASGSLDDPENIVVENLRTVDVDPSKLTVYYSDEKVYSAVILDYATGELYLVKLDEEAYNKLLSYGVGSTVTINGDVSEGAPETERILINVVVH